MKKLTACFVFLFLAALIGITLSGLSPASAASPVFAPTATSVTVAATSTITPTKTSVAPMATVTPTKTAIPPTATSVVTPTKTAIPPTATSVVTPTATLPKPTATQVVTPTATVPKPTATQAVTATATVTPVAVVTPTATATVTKTATVTATATKTPTKAPTATPTKVMAARAGAVASLSTAFTVQNMDQSTNASVTADFYDTGGNKVSSVTTCSNVLPNRSCTIDQRASGGGLDGQTNWQGSVVLSSNTQLAAVVNELAGSYGSLGVDFRMDSYNGVGTSEASTSVLMPQLLKQHLDPDTGKLYDSTIAIQNTHATTAASVTITYKNREGTTYVHSGITVPPSSSYIIALQNETVLPAYNPSKQSAFYGSGTVTADQPVAVVVNHNAPGVLNAYQGFNTSAITVKKLYFPQVMKNHLDNGYRWSTSFLVMTTASSANVTVTYTERGTGRVLQSSHVADPAYSFDARYEGVLGSIADYFGSAVITADQPIIAVVAEWTNPIGEARGQRSKYARTFAEGVGTAKVFFPLVWKNALDSASGLYFGTSAVGQVLSGTPTTLTCTYYLSDGSTRVSTFTTTASDPLFYFDSRYDANLPSGATGAAVITTSNGQPIAVTGHIFGYNFGLASGDTESSFFGVNGTP